MSRTTRYVLIELLKIFAVSLAGLTALVVFVGLAQEAIQKGLGPGPVLRLIPYVVPNALRFAVPGTMLFSVCSVYGRMAANNEIVALKSLGISPLTVMNPAIYVAVLMSVLTVWLNDVAVTWGKQGMQRIALESVEQILYGMLRTQLSYSTPDFSINVKRVDDRILQRVTMTLHGKDNGEPIVLTAAAAELRANPQENTLRIIMQNGAVDIGDKLWMEFPDKFEHDIPLTSAAKKSISRNRPSECPWWKINQRIRQQQQDMALQEQSLAAEAALDLFTGDFQDLSSSSWSEKGNGIRQGHALVYRLRTEPYRRCANGAMCFVFVFVGVPWAIWMRNADIFSTFGKCFLPILLINYPLLMLSVDRAKDGELHPAAVWLGNALLILVGLWFRRKVLRY